MMIYLGLFSIDTVHRTECMGCYVGESAQTQTYEATSVSQPSLSPLSLSARNQVPRPPITHLLAPPFGNLWWHPPSHAIARSQTREEARNAAIC